MDWSLFERDARYPLLRKELVYDNHISVRLDPLKVLPVLTSLFVDLLFRDGE
jgi:hypothetical protein